MCEQMRVMRELLATTHNHQRVEFFRDEFRKAVAGYIQAPVCTEERERWYWTAQAIAAMAIVRFGRTAWLEAQENGDYAALSIGTEA